MRIWKNPKILFNFLAILVTLVFSSSVFAQNTESSQKTVESSVNQTQAVSPTSSMAETASAEVAVVAPAPAAAPEPAAPASEEEARKPELITLDFKEADIRDVLKVISYKSGMNIVASPEVTGTVNVRIADVPWERAMDVILKTYGYAYDKQDKIIMVAPLEKLTAQRKMEQDLAQVQPTVTEVIQLKYIDAIDAKKAIDLQVSPRGRVTVLEITGQAGWGFGGSFAAKRARTGASSSRSKTLIISDIPPVLERIKEVLEGIDVKPKQILIETRLVEVNLNRLKDYGISYGTGGVGSATNSTVTTQSMTKDTKVGGTSLADIIKPAVFDPKATISGVNPYTTGLQLVFQKLTGTKFEVLLHALEENVATNTLSAPSIMTLDNQEATILVGEQFPIISTTKSSDTSTTVDVSLEEYKDIGIQLNVVPQVSGKDKDYINMILHPAVTARGELVEKYPIITTREAQTQVLIKSGETIMIGGLIKDVKNESIQGIPFLRRIPVVGKLFERKTYDTEKVELLIFITAHIVDDKNLSADQLVSLEDKLMLKGAPPLNGKALAK
jgi:type IV pilus assembly protein PilQ